MKVHVMDVKSALVKFVDQEIIPKSPHTSKLVYVGMGLLAPKMFDRALENYGEYLDLAGIRCEDNMFDVEMAEEFFSELLDKSEGWEVAGVKFTSDDVHKMANIIRRM